MQGQRCGWLLLRQEEFELQLDFIEGELTSHSVDSSITTFNVSACLVLFGIVYISLFIWFECLWYQQGSDKRDFQWYNSEAENYVSDDLMKNKIDYWLFCKILDPLVSASLIKRKTMNDGRETSKSSGEKWSLFMHVARTLSFTYLGSVIHNDDGGSHVEVSRRLSLSLWCCKFTQFEQSNSPSDACWNWVIAMSVLTTKQ